MGGVGAKQASKAPKKLNIQGGLTIKEFNSVDLPPMGKKTADNEPQNFKTISIITTQCDEKLQKFYPRSLIKNINNLN